jgi:Spy/CpxP family protein refolding chaperone
MNKTKFFAALVSGLLMSSASVLAQTTAAPAAAPTVQAAPQDDPNEVVCHAGEPEIGSRFPGPRTCHTRKEWAQIQKDSQDALFHQQMERSANSGH